MWLLASAGAALRRAGIGRIARRRPNRSDRQSGRSHDRVVSHRCVEGVGHAELGVRPDDQDRRLWRQHHDRFRALTYRDYPADELAAKFVVDSGASVVALPKHMVDNPRKSGRSNRALCAAARFFEGSEVASDRVALGEFSLRRSAASCVAGSLIVRARRRPGRSGRKLRRAGVADEMDRERPFRKGCPSQSRSEIAGCSHWRAKGLLQPLNVKNRI